LTPRERVLRAIRHELPDRVPTDAICVESMPAIAAHLGIAVEGVPDRLGLDGRIVGAPYCGEKRYSAAGAPVDEWGGEAWDDYGTAHSYPLAAAESVAEVEAYAWPDTTDYDYPAAARAAEALGGTYAVRGPYWVPVFCRVAALMGLEETLVKLHTSPAVAEGAFAAVAERVGTYCERLLAACGDHMPILCLGDDFATQRGLMLSPEAWRRFLKPHYARLFDVAKRAGKVVWFHSCGDVTAVLPDLIEMGVDVWETVQLHALPISPVELKREYGRNLTFFGGVNTQRLPFARPDEVRDEVRRCIEALGEGGGYICGPDHHIKPDVSAENTLALFDTAREFRRVGYTTQNSAAAAARSV